MIPPKRIEEIEEWKDIPGYESYYQASTFGRIKSKERIIIRSNGRAQKVNERILKPGKDGFGYLLVSLNKCNSKRTWKVHRLTAITWLNKVKGKRYVNHINGIKTDNNLYNLEWCTFQENIDHAIKLGLYDNGYAITAKGEKHGMAKLTESKVKKIRQMIDTDKYSHQQIADKFNISKSHVSSIKRRITWKN